MATFSRRLLRTVAVGGILTATIALTACATGSSDESADDGGLQTYTEGKFTVATGEPGYEPWVNADDAPETGEGFEPAVAVAVAAQLGFDADDIVWVRSSWDETIAPGVKPWDINLQQVSITDERKSAVDFSSAYYETQQAVVTIAGSPAEGVTTVDGLKGLRIGAASGTTSLTALTDVIAPTDGGHPYNNNDDAKLALTTNQVDAIVLDVPTASWFVEDGIVLGTLPAADGASDQYGIVLQKDSPLTADVTAAVDALREDGTLDDLVAEWLSWYEFPALG